MKEVLAGIIAFIVGGLIISLFGLSFYGLYIAFSASLILGIIALIVEPSPLLIGMFMFFFNYNIPEKILELIK